MITLRHLGQALAAQHRANPRATLAERLQRAAQAIRDLHRLDRLIQATVDFADALGLQVQHTLAPDRTALTIRIGAPENGELIPLRST